MNVYAFDYRMFGTTQGDEFIQRELDRIAGLGVNMMVYNIGWVFEQPTDVLHEPVYGDAGSIDACCSWVSTLPIDALVKLTDWTHGRGMRVAIRYFLWRKCSAGVGRETYAPQPADLYMEQQTQIKLFYAELCQSLGIEVFFLDAENNAFTREPLVKDLISKIRRVYHGLLSDGAYNVAAIYDCPFAADLDFLAWSDYLYDTSATTSADATAEQLTAAYLWHYANEIRPMLEHYGKPGMVIETGVNIREQPTPVVEARYTGYLEAFSQLQAAATPLVGNAWWVWNLSDPQVEPHCMRDHSAEGILAHYFTTVISDQFRYAFSQEPWSPPRIVALINGFDGKSIRDLEFWNQGGAFSGGIDTTTGQTGPSLRLSFTPGGSEVPFWYGFVWGVLPAAQDWSMQKTFNFWVKLSPASTWTSIEVNVCDRDGDRFNVRASFKASSTDWQLISVGLDLLAEPDWAPKGDGALDLRHVARWGVGFLWGDRAPRTLWLDTVYLGP